MTLGVRISANRHYITLHYITGNELLMFNVFSVWEDATRLTRSDDTKTDAVGVIAFYRRLLHYDCIVLVKQYRPALKAYTIEMPAGELKYQ